MSTLTCYRRRLPSVRVIRFRHPAIQQQTTPAPATVPDRQDHRLPRLLEAADPRRASEIVEVVKTISEWLSGTSLKGR